MKSLEGLSEGARTELLGKLPKPVDIPALFKQFDTSGDGFLQFDEMKRAFRAIGLMRKGQKFELDDVTFKAFDTEKDNKVSLEEFTANIHPKTLAKIEQLVAGGWTFDAEKWKSSAERHAVWNMVRDALQTLRFARCDAVSPLTRVRACRPASITGQGLRRLRHG